MPRGQFGSPCISLGSVVGNHADGKNALWRRRRSSRSRRFGKTGRGFRSNSRFFPYRNREGNLIGNRGHRALRHEALRRNAGAAQDAGLTTGP